MVFCRPCATDPCEAYRFGPSQRRLYHLLLPSQSAPRVDLAGVSSLVEASVFVGLKLGYDQQASSVSRVLEAIYGYATAAGSSASSSGELTLASQWLLSLTASLTTSWYDALTPPSTSGLVGDLAALPSLPGAAEDYIWVPSLRFLEADGVHAAFQQTTYTGRDFEDVFIAALASRGGASACLLEFSAFSNKYGFIPPADLPARLTSLGVKDRRLAVSMLQSWRLPVEDLLDLLPSFSAPPARSLGF